MTFTGDAVAVYGGASFDHGNYTVSLDGVPQREFSGGSNGQVRMYHPQVNTTFMLHFTPKLTVFVFQVLLVCNSSLPGAYWGTEHYMTTVLCDQSGQWHSQFDCHEQGDRQLKFPGRRPNRCLEFTKL